MKMKLNSTRVRSMNELIELDNKEKQTAYNKWYDKTYHTYSSDSYYSGFAGWNGCKKKILGMIKRNATHISADMTDLIKAVEKL